MKNNKTIIFLLLMLFSLFSYTQAKNKYSFKFVYQKNKGENTILHYEFKNNSDSGAWFIFKNNFNKINSNENILFHTSSPYSVEKSQKIAFYKDTVLLFDNFYKCSGYRFIYLAAKQSYKIKIFSMLNAYNYGKNGYVYIYKNIYINDTADIKELKFNNEINLNTFCNKTDNISCKGYSLIDTLYKNFKLSFSQRLACLRDTICKDIIYNPCLWDFMPIKSDTNFIIKTHSNNINKKQKNSKKNIEITYIGEHNKFYKKKNEYEYCKPFNKLFFEHFKDSASYKVLKINNSRNSGIFIAKNFSRRMNFDENINSIYFQSKNVSGLLKIIIVENNNIKYHTQDFPLPVKILYYIPPNSEHIIYNDCLFYSRFWKKYVFGSDGNIQKKRKLKFYIFDDVLINNEYNLSDAFYFDKEYFTNYSCLNENQIHLSFINKIKYTNFFNRILNR